MSTAWYLTIQGFGKRRLYSKNRLRRKKAHRQPLSNCGCSVAHGIVPFSFPADSEAIPFKRGDVQQCRVPTLIVLNWREAFRLNGCPQRGWSSKRLPLCLQAF